MYSFIKNYVFQHMKIVNEWLWESFCGDGGEGLIWIGLEQEVLWFLSVICGQGRHREAWRTVMDHSVF